MAKRRLHLLKRPKNTHTVNQIPGTMTYVGHKAGNETKLDVIDYNKEAYERFSSKSTEDAFKFMDEDRITWFNIDGLNNISEIEKLGKHYELHPLVLEDIVNTGQRPKIEEYQDYLFIVAKMLYFEQRGDSHEIVQEHISFIVGSNYLLSFQESDGDVFNPVRERIETAKGRIRSRSADYLMFALLDAIIDNYFIVIDDMSDRIEALEESLFTAQPNDDITIEIQDLKKNILRIRRAVFPLREVISRLEKLESELIEEKTKNYLRDLYDHIIQISENIDIYREMIWGLMDMYMTTISNKMNEVMKVLTIMASIFIPLTFIAGIYGMNFEYIPELQWHYSYFVLWGVMIFVFLMMLYYFKRKKWL
ncbi:magnesium/cobalt transporter CorA [Gramella sp. AN32]|uniref:Magnesium transport protein CorA n=1 Tax=Christiangramia antarctica TaxID=2058158 RepID=A0ABW5X6J0_9FLAO|nr:magnesium/cobalt transporter CorA [Gramella sp. AN32]MCM4156111.1 magnesium and cobalt transport protein CorA [Gramella sp. AN32]